MGCHFLIRRFDDPSGSDLTYRAGDVVDWLPDTEPHFGTAAAIYEKHYFLTVSDVTEEQAQEFVEDVNEPRVLPNGRTQNRRKKLRDYYLDIPSFRASLTAGQLANFDATDNIPLVVVLADVQPHVKRR